MSPPAIFARIFAFAERSHGRACALLLLLGLALFLPGHSGLQPMDRDEPRFAQATKQMLESRDFVDIRFLDEARHKKPVGIYWIQSAVVSAAEALGFDGARAEIGFYRIPSLIGALLTMLFTYAAATAFVGRRAAFVAAVLTGATILLGVEARLAKTDAMVTATVTGAMAVLAHAFARRDGDEPLGWPAAVGFWLAIGLGILVKGPITPAVVALAAAVLSIHRRSGTWLRALRPGIGSLIVLLIVLPWFVAITVKSGGAFFEASLGEDMLAKVGQAKERHGAPPGTYLAAFLGTAWPLVPFALLAVPFAWRERRLPAVAFCLAWIVPMWLVFEAVSTKLPHYVLPMYPGIALLAAVAADRGRTVLQGAAAFVLSWWLVVPVAAAAAAVFFGARYLGDAPPWIGVPLLVLAVVPAAWAALLLRRAQVGSAALAAALSAVVLANGAYAFSAPALRSLHVSERLAEASRAAGCADPLVASAGFSEPSLVFLTSTRIVLTSGAGAAEFLGGPGCRVVFVEQRQAEAFARASEAAGLKPRLITRIEGININGGRRLDLAVLSREIAP